jgi:hypothetical protein
MLSAHDRDAIAPTTFPVSRISRIFLFRTRRSRAGQRARPADRKRNILIQDAYETRAGSLSLTQCAHRLETADHGLHARARTWSLRWANAERSAAAIPAADAARAVLFLQSVDGDQKFFDAAFEARKLCFEAGFAILVVVGVVHGGGL